MLVHRTRARVNGIDTDAGGRIHFTAVFRLVEQAEAGLVREVGLIDEWWQYPRRHVEAECLQTIGFNDELEVSIWAERVGRSSVTWRWTIERDGDVCATGGSTVVRVDDTGSPISVSDKLREALLGSIET